MSPVYDYFFILGADTRNPVFVKVTACTEPEAGERLPLSLSDEGAPDHLT